MSNVIIRQPLLPQPYYPPQPRMVPVQFAPLPDIFNAMPVDQARFQPRGTVPQQGVYFQPAQARPAQPLPAYTLPANLVAGGPSPFDQPANSTGTYTKKFVKSVEKVGESAAHQLIGTGVAVAGAAKTAVYAPLGAIEAVGRTAIALTGGNVSYDKPSPLHHMGDGIQTMGQGAGLVLIATGNQAVAATEAMVYAPLAGLELVAHTAGVVAGSAVWVGKQVNDSFVGKEFWAGYHQVMPSKPSKN